MYYLIQWKGKSIKMTNQEYILCLKRQNAATKALSLAQDQLEGIAIAINYNPGKFAKELNEVVTKLDLAKKELFLSKYIPNKWSSNIQRKAKREQEIIPIGQPLERIKLCKFGQAKREVKE